MTVRYCTTSGELRCFESDTPEAWADFDAFCNVQVWRPGIVCLRGLKGEVSRKVMRQIVETLVAQGVTTIYAERAPHRRLPCASHVGSGDFAGMWRIDLEAITRARS